MNDNKKFIGGLLLGAAAGAALALYFSSDKGKQTIANAKAKADDWGNDLSATLTRFDEELAAIVQKGKAFVADMEQKTTV